MTIDLAPEHAAYAALIQMFEQHVNTIRSIDEQLGDTAAKGASYFNELKEQNPEATARGNEILKQINEMDDKTAQAVVAFIVSRDRGIAQLATEYAKANQPSEEAVKLSNDRIAELWNKRSVEQRSASALHTAIGLSPLPDEVKAQLPELPAGKKGAAPGTKRGKMGRKIPPGYHWEVAGEEVGEKNTKDLADLLGVKVADVRNHLQSEYQDGLPNVFETEINGKSLKGVLTTEPTTPAADDDDDDDTDDLGELDFDDDDTEDNED